MANQVSKRLCLQARLTDSNQNLAAKALLLVAELAKALGPAVDAKAGRQLLLASVARLNDNKKPVRSHILFPSGQTLEQ